MGLLVLSSDVDAAEIDTVVAADVTVPVATVAGFFGNTVSTTDMCFSRKCFPKFDVFPPRMERVVLHISHFAVSSLSAVKCIHTKLRFFRSDIFDYTCYNG